VGVLGSVGVYLMLHRSITRIILGIGMLGNAINLLIVAVGQVILASLTGRRLEHALVFAGLITLIVTLYDRYRPIHVARFESHHE
jgi:multisubunit Na+/H+ antiporter MnhC subunit